jgi:oligopeptide/dipeptide ABC transporter ATP-binding protein
MADRVAVMYAGRIVEEGPVSDVFAQPQHPYTRALLASLPGSRVSEPAAGRRLRAIEGTVPTLTHLPSGCPFEPRCDARIDVCRAEVPPLSPLGADKAARCVHVKAGER